MIENALNHEGQSNVACSQLILNPIGEKIVDMFFPNDTEHLRFANFAKVYSIFRPTSTKTPTYADNSRDGKVYTIIIAEDSLMIAN